MKFLEIFRRDGPEPTTGGVVIGATTIALLTIGLPVLAIYTLSSRGLDPKQAELLDMQRIKEIGALHQAAGDKFLFDPEGRFDPFALMSVQAEAYFDLCQSARGRGGSSIAEIRAGDYRSFPYGRGMVKGKPNRMLLWDLEVDPEYQTRLVYFANGTVSIISESEFQARLAESTSTSGS